MSSSLKSWICLLCIAPALLHLSDAVRCFICNSQFNPQCHDPFVYNSLPLQSCDQYGSSSGGSYPGYGQSGYQSGYQPGYQSGGYQPGFQSGGYQPGYQSGGYQPGYQSGNQPYPSFGNQPGSPGSSGYGRSNMCTKITMKVGDRWNVERGCGRADYNRGEVCLSNNNGGYMCNCMGDGCNGATRGSAISWLTLALMASLVIFYSR